MAMTSLNKRNGKNERGNEVRRKRAMSRRIAEVGRKRNGRVWNKRMRARAAMVVIVGPRRLNTRARVKAKGRSGMILLTMILDPNLTLTIIVQTRNRDQSQSQRRRKQRQKRKHPRAQNVLNSNLRRQTTTPTEGPSSTEPFAKSE
jgi:hypothetical protein